jgi:hypothetical protein
MFLAPFRWLTRNFELLLALILAFVVWVCCSQR